MLSSERYRTLVEHRPHFVFLANVPTAKMPHKAILEDALDAIRDHRNHPVVRTVYAELAQYCAQWMVPSEVLVAELVACATAALDHPDAVRVLARAIWRSVGDDPLDDDNPRVVNWIAKLAARALREEQLPTFAAVLCVLCHIRAFDGAMPDAWVDGLTRAREIPKAREYLFSFVQDYDQRFVRSTQGPAWIMAMRTDPRLVDTQSTARSKRCPLCNHCEE